MGKGLARKLAKRLIQENEKGRPWRKIADDYPMLNKDGKPIVKAGTLSRIAGGGYMPSKKEILIALGLKTRKYIAAREIIEAMSNMTRQALRWKKRKNERG